MKKRIVTIAVVVVVMGACFALGVLAARPKNTSASNQEAQQVADTNAVSSTNLDADATEVATSSGDLQGKKIVMIDRYDGYALTDAEIQSLVSQNEQMDLGRTTFYIVATEGDEYVDEATGLTFLVEKGNDFVISKGCVVYELGGASLSQILDGEVNEDSFNFSREVETNHGTFSLYN